MALQRADGQVNMTDACPLVGYLRLTGEHFNNCISKWILEYGRHWEPQALPRQHPRGVIKQCYSNAANLALGDSDLTYVEGYACGIIPVMHAWCVDKDGKVIDNTWDEPAKSLYYGVPFDRGFLAKTICRNGVYGLIDCYTDGFKLVKGEAGGPEEWLGWPRDQG